MNVCIKFHGNASKNISVPWAVLLALARNCSPRNSFFCFSLCEAEFFTAPSALPQLLREFPGGCPCEKLRLSLQRVVVWLTVLIRDSQKWQRIKSLPCKDYRPLRHHVHHQSWIYTASHPPTSLHSNCACHFKTQLLSRIQPTPRRAARALCHSMHQVQA